MVKTLKKAPTKKKQEWVNDIVAEAKIKGVELNEKQIANMESKVIIPTLKTFYDLLKQS